MQLFARERLLKTQPRGMVTGKAQAQASSLQLGMLLDRVRPIGTEITRSVCPEMSWKTSASSLLGAVVIRWWEMSSCRAGLDSNQGAEGAGFSPPSEGSRYCLSPFPCRSLQLNKPVSISVKLLKGELAIRAGLDLDRNVFYSIRGVFSKTWLC